MKIRKGQLKVGRFIVPYRSYGDASQFIVCVNGAQQTMAAWKSVVSYFSKDYRLVLFDFPGQGRAQNRLQLQVDLLSRIVLSDKLFQA